MYEHEIKEWLRRKSIQSLEKMLTDTIDRLIECEEILYNEDEEEFIWSHSGDNLDPISKKNGSIS